MKRSISAISTIAWNHLAQVLLFWVCFSLWCRGKPSPWHPLFSTMFPFRGRVIVSTHASSSYHGGLLNQCGKFYKKVWLELLSWNDPFENQKMQQRGELKKIKNKKFGCGLCPRIWLQDHQPLTLTTKNIPFFSLLFFKNSKVMDVTSSFIESAQAQGEFNFSLMFWWLNDSSWRQDFTKAQGVLRDRPTSININCDA